MSDAALVVVVAIALAFDFTNGFHDTANAVATSVSTRALSPRLAVLIAAIMNFVGAFSSTKVAKTVGGGLINTSPGFVTVRTNVAASPTSTLEGPVALRVNLGSVTLTFIAEDPVNVTPSMPGWDTRNSPAELGPNPWTTL